MVRGLSGLGTVLPAAASTQTTETPFPAATLPVMLPASMAIAQNTVSARIIRSLNMMKIGSFRDQYTNSRPKSAVFTRNGLAAINLPVSGSVSITTDCSGRIWYSNENLIFGWIRNWSPGVNRFRVEWTGAKNGVLAASANPLMRSAVELTPSQRIIAITQGCSIKSACTNPPSNCAGTLLMKFTGRGELEVRGNERSE